MEYKIKGSTFFVLRQFIDKKFGRNSFDIQFHKYYAIKPENIVPGNWYCIKPLLTWLEDDSKAHDLDYADYVQEMNEFISTQSLGSIQKFLFKMMGPKLSLNIRKQSALAIQNCSKIKKELSFDRFYRAEHTVPDFLMRWQIPAHKGSFSGLLKACGNSLDHFSVVETHSYEEKGQKMSRMVFEVLYS